MLKFFRLPFATTGDKTAVPDAVDSNGNVSYSQGYGFDYQRQKTDPAAKNIERDKMNQILFDITTAIAEIQSQGAPDYITSALNGGTAYSYGQYAIVKYSGALYISLVAANTALPSDATKWALLPTPALLQQSAYMSANAAGTVDAITAAFTPAIAALPAAPGTLSVFVRATGANTSTTPTFKADGTAAKTIVKGNNVALLAGDIAGAGHWLELQYDPTLDKWVLQNPTHGFGGTPPQFDNTLKTATTEFVQRALGNRQGYNVPATGSSFSAADAGKTFGLNGPSTYTLPSASGLPNGATFDFFATGNGCVVQASGSDTITIKGGTTVTSLTLNSGDTLSLVRVGPTAWLAISGSAQLKFADVFGSSLAASGYQKLPSGLIVQWGSIVTSATANVTVTFPIAFPNNVFNISCTPDNSGGSGSWAAYSGSSITLSGVQIAGWASSASRSVITVNWIAIGR